MFAQGPDMYRSATKALKLPAHLRKTFLWSTPSDTHTRIVDCETAANDYDECNHFARGFMVQAQPGHDQREIQVARYKEQGYRFYEADGMLYFYPGQRCLASRENPHRVFLDRPPNLAVVGGDWRGNPRGEGRTHTKIEHWVDDLHSNVDKLNTEIQKG